MQIDVAQIRLPAKTRFSKHQQLSLAFDNAVAVFGLPLWADVNPTV